MVLMYQFLEGLHKQVMIFAMSASKESPNGEDYRAVDRFLYLTFGDWAGRKNNHYWLARHAHSVRREFNVILHIIRIGHPAMVSGEESTHADDLGSPHREWKLTQIEAFASSCWNTRND